MNFRILTILTALAFLGFSVTALAHPCDRDPGHRHCNTEPEPEYTAELTTGDFVFGTSTGTLDGLTPNRKGTGLPGNQLLEMDPDPDGASGWATIFGDCSALVSGGVVTGFDVQDDNWSIHYTKSKRDLNKIHITMRNLIIYPGTSQDYSQVQFDLDLHGEIETQVPFLPDKGDPPSEFQLIKYKLWAGGHGPNGQFTCNSVGGGWDDWPLLDLESTLEIRGPL